ncbi:GPSM2 protein, partial [Polypterus senegalus]
LTYRMEASCLELALEGERLCKLSDYRAGVSFFEAAIQVGTEDLQILSAIYSQLGNAYFHLHDYSKALEYHHHDLTLTRTIGDQLGEAKASGNLGNTLKVLGRFDEAIVCCQRHLDISTEFNDKVGEARSLYNFGNVYHAKGKSICWTGADPGEFPEEATVALQKATEYYEANLLIVKELGDRAAQGRTYGNLGNTHYLLGNFRKAVTSHEQRLLIAKEFGDKAAERRAYCNLGNAYIFLGEFEVASEHYKRTLQLARQLKDRAVEAQACYSLGNTYTLLQDYERAIDYHLKHLIIAQELSARPRTGRRHSMENMELMKLTPDKAKSTDILGEEGFFDLLSRFQSNRMDDQRCSIQTESNGILGSVDTTSSTPRAMRKSHTISVISPHTDEFLDLVASSQSRRLDDQRASLGSFPGLRLNQKNSQSVLSHLMANADTKEPDEDFFDMLVKCQGARLDDQRCAPPPPATKGPTVPDEDFFSLIIRSQAKRMDEQRVTLPLNQERPNSS